MCVLNSGSAHSHVVLLKNSLLTKVYPASEIMKPTADM